MKILIQDAEILNSPSPHHKKVRNLLIGNGRIEKIGDKKFTADRVIEAKGMKLSAGWFDLGTFVGDPGYEHKEDLTSACDAAMAGGFTGLAMLPNTHPSIQSKNAVHYAGKGNEARLVQVFAIAAVTKDNKGEELTEMIDLHEAGAVAFSDGLKPLWHTDLFTKSLQYLQRFDGLLIDRPEDQWLNMHGQMHEGVQSTRLGLKGMPRIAEEIVVGRDLELLAYAGGKLHLARISTAKSLTLIAAAKKKLNVTCDVAVYQPLLTDALLEDFDTSLKVNPPLREPRDNEALVKGINDGTVDIICSGHLPQDEESKNLEFDLAEHGMIGLQTFGANLSALAGQAGWEVLMECVSVAPRRRLGLEVPVIDADAPANLTLLDPKAEWTLDATTNRSKSRNSPWFGKPLRGRVMAVFNNNKHYFPK